MIAWGHGTGIRNSSCCLRRTVLTADGWDVVDITVTTFLCIHAEVVTLPCSTVSESPLLHVDKQCKVLEMNIVVYCIQTGIGWRVKCSLLCHHSHMHIHLSLSLSLTHTHTHTHACTHTSTLILWYVHVRLVAVASYPHNYVFTKAFPHPYQLRPLLWCVYNCVCICTCLCLCICEFICAHVCTRTYIYTYMLHVYTHVTQVMHTYQCTFVHRYVCVYIYMYISYCKYLYIYMNGYLWCTHAYNVHTYICVACINVYTHAHHPHTPPYTHLLGSEGFFTTGGKPLLSFLTVLHP